MTEIKKAIKILEDYGFTKESEDSFQQFTPLGEDWHIYINCTSVENIANSIDTCLACIDDDTVMYADMRGKHGIPDSFWALINDGEWKKKQLEDVLKEIREKEV